MTLWSKVGNNYLCEIILWRNKKPTTNQKIEKIVVLKSIIPVLKFDESAAEQYGRIRANLESRGLIIGSNDLLIAAI